tara:strand:+ start:274 stop:486 length:213 start_codon:yes stop_codon:yes gene_type:complete
LICIHRSKPKLNKIVTIAVPPYEIRGKGTPTTGIKPITIDILIKIYRKKVEVIPIPKNLPKLDLELNEMK